MSRVDHWRETLVFFPKLPHFFFFFTVMKMMYFIFFIYFCIRVELTYSVVSISAVQRRDPVISIYTFFFLRCLPSCSVQLSTCPTFSADPPSPPGPPGTQSVCPHRAVLFAAVLMHKTMAARVRATILFATETGRSETLARDLGTLFSCAFNPKVAHPACVQRSLGKVKTIALLLGVPAPRTWERTL